MQNLRVLGLVLLAACGSSSSGDDTTTADAGPGGPDAAPGERYIPAGYTLTPFLSETATTHAFAMADQVLEAGKDYQAVLVTTAGRIVFDLLETDTPITVNSFVFLARHHYFDGIAFHRVIEGFVAQGGDPNSISGPPGTWGVGGPGYGYGLEIVDSLKFNAAGVVGMARTMDPNSNGSQFFISLKAITLADPYTIFAKVVEGSEVLPMITRGEPPANPTRMTEVYIVEK